jgi:hypothetical protein
MDDDYAISKELEKYDTQREKVLRLNELGNYYCISYGNKYIYTIISNGYIQGKFVCNIIGIGVQQDGCLFCKSTTYNITGNIQLKIKNCNKVCYYLCLTCYSKNCKLCTTCLRELKECAAIKKIKTIKTTFWLCATHKFIFPKDICRIIINLFFCKKIEFLKLINLSYFPN